MDIVMGTRYWVTEEERHGVVTGFCSDLVLILFDSGGEKWVIKAQLRSPKSHKVKS